MTTLPLSERAYATLPRPLRYMYWGGLIGLAIAIVATFVSAFAYGQAEGMTAGSCVVYGCVVTLLLSQLSGVGGLIVGGGVGALAGGAVGAVLERRRASGR